MLDEKIAAATDVIGGALGEARAPAAAFGGGNDSVVLLHLIKTGMGGRIGLPVVCVDPPGEYARLYFFIEKMRKLWGLDIMRMRGGPDEVYELAESACEGVYPGVSGLVDTLSRRFGFSHVFMGLRRGEEGVGGRIAPVMDCASATLVNPLVDFTESDVHDYIKRHNLPSCSLYRDGTSKLHCLPAGTVFRKAAAPIAQGRKEEETEIRERLKALGYL